MLSNCSLENHSEAFTKHFEEVTSIIEKLADSFESFTVPIEALTSDFESTGGIFESLTDSLEMQTVLFEKLVIVSVIELGNTVKSFYLLKGRIK